LIALRENDSPGAALRWALEMAGALTVGLHVLQVLPGGSYQVGRRSTRFFAQVLRSGRVAVPAQTQACASRGRGGVIESAGILQGDFVEQTAQYAGATKPTLIVLANDGEGPSEYATLLACTTRRPVLVAQSPSGAQTAVEHGTVLALAAIELFSDGGSLRPGLGQRERSKSVATRSDRGTTDRLQYPQCTASGHRQ
jgi:hypothetical protein